MQQQICRSEFPRPDFLRENWQTLNGQWAFEFDYDNDFENQPNFLAREFSNEITVPFCYQSKASGIGETKDCDAVWYRRTFDCQTTEGRVLLKFGAVDSEAKIWLNGAFIGEHCGGNVGFEFDVTHVVIERNNILVVKATDCRNADKPRGKQSWTGEKFECWYTPTTGIWQSVWIEYVGSTYVKHVKLTPDVDSLTAECELFLSSYADSNVQVEVNFSLNGKKQPTMQSEFTVKNGYGKTVFAFKDLDFKCDWLFWSPGSPNLIDVTVTVLNDRCNDCVQTYFGMRKISVRNGKIMLNNHYFYQRLLLDQGYWPDTLLTPPSDEAIVQDIKLTKEMGFNGARKHQKIEDPRYYYWADQLGLLVWGELPSAYEFNDNAMTNSSAELIEFIKRDFNHPSIVTWAPVNESWGVRDIQTNVQQQNYAKMLYFLIKSLDKTRLVSSNDGWEQLNESDICALHDYTVFPDIADKYEDMNRFFNDDTLNRRPYADNNQYNGQPIMMTEYGGIAFSDTDEDSWGYFGKVSTEQEFFERLEPITDMLIQSGQFCGFCYTQLTDVMQEVNGLLTEDRKPKLPVEKLKAVFGKQCV